MTGTLERIAAVLRAAGIVDAEKEAAALAAAATDGDTANALAERRAAGEPLAYLVGRVAFLGVELLAAPGALVPRSETEVLGGAALSYLRAASVAGELRVIDLCCGSGNLACALAAQVPAARVWAADLTASCVELARRNVAHLALGGRVEVAQGDLFAPFAGLGLEGGVDLVVCNPPYISTGRLGKDRAELLRHEPVEAFDGGPFGLTIHQRVVKECLPFLKPGGWLMMEVGLGQDRQVKTLIERTGAYAELAFALDGEGRPRAARARKT